MSLVLEQLDASKAYYGLKTAGKADGFDCGHEVINKFVAGSLWQAVRVGNCIGFVLLDQTKVDLNGNEFFAGFYTMAMATIDSGPLKGKGGNFPRQVSCMRLGMLGVDGAYQKQGLGSRLMKHAMGRAQIACEQFGGRGVYLDADPGALDFYLSLGFLALPEPEPHKPTPMFLFKECFP